MFTQMCQNCPPPLVIYENIQITHNERELAGKIISRNWNEWNRQYNVEIYENGQIKCVWVDENKIAPNYEAEQPKKKQRLN